MVRSKREIHLVSRAETICNEWLYRLDKDPNPLGRGQVVSPADCVDGVQDRLAPPDTSLQTKPLGSPS